MYNQVLDTHRSVALQRHLPLARRSWPAAEAGGQK